ncbi:MAG: Gfo/Idh/MocA family oxidoreductase [Myxococcota bacterium]
MTTRVAVIGCGYWGPNLIRNFSSLESAEVRWVCDLDPGVLAGLKARYPAVRTSTDPREAIDDPEVDAVAICTPVATHAGLALQALQGGKHILVEKPLTDSTETAEELVALAERSGLILQVDHTFVYSGAVRKVAEIVRSGELGELLYIDCVRINLGLFQSDVNVVWDLAPHDLSIIDHLVGQEPHWVSAIGSRHLAPVESQAYVTMQFEGSLIAHLHVNWLAPVKLRSTVIGGSRKMIVYDDLAPSEKVRVYEKGVSLQSGAPERARALVDYRVGDMLAPHLDKTEPLESVCLSFLDAIRTGTPPATDGRSGLRIVRQLEAAQKSLRREGARVPIRGGR